MNIKQASLIKHSLATFMIVGVLSLSIPPILAYLCAINLVCFISFGFDKKAAIRQWRRVPERTFLTLGFLGAFPALLIGRKVFHHKTLKKGFILPMWTLFIMQMSLVVYLFYIS